MKVQLLSTERGMKSRSLKRLADELSLRLKYKVFRTMQIRAGVAQYRYGHQVNKLAQYEWFQKKGISSLEFTTDKKKAAQWLHKGETVFGRETLTGSQGKGIVILEPGCAKIPDCPVYTLYKKKKREFRVHVFQNKVVCIVEKLKKKDWEGPSDSRIRNLANGYVFAQNFQITPALQKRLEEVALAASKVCFRSDFRGVDIGYNESKDDVFVLEVNSAPGIEGNNVGKYADLLIESIPQ
jgi:hypothetical protein